MKKNILLVIVFVCLFNFSLVAEVKTLDSLLEEHKSKDYISDIKVLVDEDINAKDKNADTALILASLNGHTDIVNALIAENADVNIQNKWKNTALILASRDGHTEIVELLKTTIFSAKSETRE